MTWWKTFVGWWYRSPFWHPATWVAHGLVGFGLGFVFKEYGAGIAFGLYGRKEYVESRDGITLDNVLDFVFPVVGALIGAWVR